MLDDDVTLVAPDGATGCDGHVDCSALLDAPPDAGADRREPADPGDAPPVVGDTPPRDPDGNGIYEDVNGDGAVTPGDATVLFDQAFGT